MTPRTVLTIAGSDSGGGAGLQADLRTFAAFGVHGTTAVTAVTAQNTKAVAEVVALDPEMVVAQIAAVQSDMEVEAVKTGMLAGPATVSAVASMAAEGRLANLVVDPVLVSSSGYPLMGPGGVDAYRAELLPKARVATPNLREAAVLTGQDVDAVTGVDEMADMAVEIGSWGPGTVVVKGGHLRGRHSPDVVLVDGRIEILGAERVATPNDHGTGCSLSAAICALLALGRPPAEAVVTAKAFVGRALRGAAGWQLGEGHGPIDHLGWG